MTYVSSVTDTQIFTGLRAFLVDAVGSGIEVVQALDNRVPSPKGAFILMSELFRTRLAMNETTYSDATTPAPGVHTEEVKASTKIAFQLDCYGPSASEYAQVIDTAWRSHLAVDFLKSYGLTPLFNDGPRKMPVVNGEHQYELRWVVTVHLQVNPSITAPREFADVPPVPEVIDVLATYSII